MDLIAYGFILQNRMIVTIDSFEGLKRIEFQKIKIKLLLLLIFFKQMCLSMLVREEIDSGLVASKVNIRQDIFLAEG